MPFITLVTFIMSLIKKSLQLELYAFTKQLNENKGTDAPHVTKQAFSKARQNLKPEAFKFLNKQILTDFYSDNEIKTFKGFRLLAIDGSTALLPSNEKLEEEFGTQANQFVKVPMARTSVFFDVLNGTTIDASITKYTISETKLVLSHILELLEIDAKTHFRVLGKNLILFDRGYPSVPLFFFLKLMGIDFIMRAKTSYMKEITEIVESGQLDTTITIPLYRPGQKISSEFLPYMPARSQKPSIQVRVAVCDLSSGEIEVLITSLLDPDAFTYDDLFYCYMKRWCAEEGLKLHKNAAEMENFSGELKIAIEQEFHATIFACNVATIIAEEAAEEVNEEHKTKGLKYEYRPNKSIGLGILKEEILDVFLGDGDLDIVTNKIKKEMKRNLVAVRPGRSFDRTVHQKSPSKARQKRRHL